MTQSIACIRSNEPGADNARLRAVLEAANLRAGRQLAGQLLTLYDHNDFLLATWIDDAARAKWSSVISSAWAEHSGDAPALHLVPSYEDFDYDEEILDHGAHL